jgi:TolB protein
MRVPTSRTSRVLTQALFAVTVAACGAPSAPLASTTPSASASADRIPGSASPSATAEPDHPAAGLALVRFPDDGSPASQVFVVDEDGELRQLTGLGDPASIGASSPLWSPDRSQLVVLPPKVGAPFPGYVAVVNADGTDERRVAEVAGTFLPSVSWSPDGTRFVFAEVVESVSGPNEPTMWLVVPESGAATQLGVGTSPRWLPDGERISFQRAVAGTDPADPLAVIVEQHLMDVESGETQRFATANEAFWSPDGTAVILALESGQLALADADGSNPRVLARGGGPVWSPDGRRIVFQSGTDSNGIPLLTLIERDGRALWSGGVAGSRPTWSPDGMRLAVEVGVPESQVEVIDAATGERLWRTAGSMPSWTP